MSVVLKVNEFKPALTDFFEQSGVSKKQVRKQFSWNGELVHKQLLADVFLATRRMQVQYSFYFQLFWFLPTPEGNTWLDILIIVALKTIWWWFCYLLDEFT